MTVNKNLAIIAATDGSCLSNPGPGGWGYLIRFEDKSILESGGFEANTTNNRMELMAALMTLKKLKEIPIKKPFKLRTDSKYLIQGFQDWTPNWKKNGWKTSNGKAVKNQDLWEELDRLRDPDIILEFVKGHSGDPDNDRVDEIATSFSKKIKISLNQTNIEKEKLINTKLDSIKALNQLLTKLEMVNSFASKRYKLTSDELNNLLDFSNNQEIINKKEFLWREWIIQPINNNLWIIKNHQE
tara:strand:+ start:9421 stop:10146 length:726 start_codon:yes stop_codon:yes gene_type:complete